MTGTFVLPFGRMIIGGRDTGMEAAVLILFCVILIVFVVLDLSILPALLLGLALFLLYGRKKGFSFRSLSGMCLEGVRTVGNIMLILLIIGILTAMWRASGCIPAIVYYASGLIHPKIFILVTFLLCVLVSLLTGTAFGTAATMGTICASIAVSMNLPLFWVGGAVLAGAFFGDRCSPLSTSALLVGTVTKTDIYTNIRHMVRTAAVPFALTCIVYAIAGFFIVTDGPMPDVKALFVPSFSISPLCLLPAAVIFILAPFRIKIRVIMLISAGIAVIVALFTQEVSPGALLSFALSGYRTQSPALSAMLDGGGITSMLRSACIICIASCYAGLFRHLGLLDFLHTLVDKTDSRLGHYATVLLVSLPVSAISCNQTLAIMLTNQVTAALPVTDQERALNLEDSVVVTAPLIPWSIASAVPLASVGAPSLSILAACYLFLLPVWRLIRKQVIK